MHHALLNISSKLQEDLLWRNDKVFPSTESFGSILFSIYETFSSQSWIFLLYFCWPLAIFAMNRWLQYRGSMKSQLTSWSLSDIPRLAELSRRNSSLSDIESSLLGWKAIVSLGTGGIVSKFYSKWSQTRIKSTLYSTLTTFEGKRPVVHN